MRDVFVLGIGAGNDLPLMRRLARTGWRVRYGAVMLNLAMRSRAVHDARVLPADATDWVEFLTAWADEVVSPDAPRPLLVPTNDRGVACVLDDHARAAARFALPTVSAESTPSLFYKDRLYALCAQHGVPHTETVAIADAATPQPARPARFPVVAKPAAPKQPMVADQRRKVMVLRDAAAWNDFVGRRVPTTRVVFSTWAPHERKVLCAGFVDRDGHLSFANTFLVERMHPPGDGNAVLCTPFEEPWFAAQAERLARAAGYCGFVELEFVQHSASGDWLAIDVQCRPTLQNAALAARGLDFDAGLRHLLDGSAAAPTTQRRGRAWVDLPRLVEWVRTPGLPRGDRCRVLLRAGALLATGRAVESTFAWRDPLPLLKTLYWALRRPPPRDLQ